MQERTIYGVVEGCRVERAGCRVRVGGGFRAARALGDHPAKRVSKAASALAESGSPLAVPSLKLSKLINYILLITFNIFYSLKYLFIIKYSYLFNNVKYS